MSLHIDIITCLPKLLKSPFSESILKRGQQNGMVKIVIHDIRKYTTDKHHIVDESPYGGGAGMILKPEPIFACVEKLQKKRKYDEIIYMTADGVPLKQNTAVELSLKNNLLIICGHYKGIDERIREKLVTKEISLGDYILTGGELAAAVLVDAIVRLVPGVIGDAESLLGDSFQDGLLDGPNYTRPADFRGMKVPEVLLKGNHKEIESWREKQKISRTQERRADLLHN
ncbi:MAG: tRNA (guanosine(37)-N1)-methyltransferase TrmD [Ignavibacteria bacterium]|nr:tRNA (guanosine(37)-N1)-methyltransferase TrmD [Ignavibacteria bacterium]